MEGQTPSAESAEATEEVWDEGVFRQRERTIDNIKRIYAVVYSLSLTYALKEVFEFTQAYLLDATHRSIGQGLALRIMMLFILASTVSIFAYQGDKFLDLRYTMRPQGRPHHPRPKGCRDGVVGILLLIRAALF